MSDFKLAYKIEDKNITILLLVIKKRENNEIYFYNEKYECDFLIKSDNKLQAIQVAHELNDFNFEREVRSLINLSFEAEKFIITFNQENKYKNINIIPFYEFFGFLEVFI